MKSEEQNSAFRRCGVIEGFYGKPYSHRQRLDLLQFLSEQGLNDYTYAPKNDSYHRHKWTESYPATKLRQFRQLQMKAEKLGVIFSFAVSPGLSIDYNSVRNLDSLIAKFQSIYEIGCRNFALLLDDIRPEPPDSNLAKKQIFLIQQLRSKWADVNWRICPTEYCGDGDSDYLRELGEELPSQIAIFWTGPEVCSYQISTDYLKKIANVLQRPPLIWDNYPVNDASMTSQIHLRPLIGRDSTLATVAEGVLTNPMTQYEASKIPLMTMAAYCRDSKNYDPQTALNQALLTACNSDELLYFQNFIEYSSLSCLYPDPAKSLFSLIDKIFTEAQSEEHLNQLLKICQEMQATAKTILNLSNLLLRRELGGWAKRLQTWGEFGENSIIRLQPLWNAADWNSLIARKVLLRTLQTQLLRLLAERRYTMAPDALYESAWTGIYQTCKKGKIV